MALSLDVVAKPTLHTPGWVQHAGETVRKPLRQSSTAALIYRDWLRRLPILTGKSHTAMAAEIGIAVTTLTKPIRPDDPGTSTPNQRTIDRIVARYHVAPPDFGSQRGPLRAFAADAEPYQQDHDTALAGAVRSLIDGRTTVSPWILKSRAIELIGYLPGDVVLVDAAPLPHPGDAVCAQTNIDFRRGTAETAMRIYERVRSSYVLVASSMDPRFRAPIAVDDRVEIKGVISGMVRPILTAHT